MKAIRVSEEWHKALVYHIRYEYILSEVKLDPSRKDFFTPKWEFSSDNINDRYILVLDDDNNPVSTIRFLIDEYGNGLIERVRTMPGKFKKGYGRLAMEEGERWLYDLGVRHVFVEAIERALDFYKKCGYSFSKKENVLRNHNDLYLMEKSL